jgi:hypothetical protein
MKGSTKRAMSAVLGTGIAVLSTAGACPAANAAACTDSFVGANNAKWTEAANWNTGRVPTREDVVCIPAGVTASLWFFREVPNSVSVRAIQGGSVNTNTELYVSGQPPEYSSSIEKLFVEGTRVAVESHAELTITKELLVKGSSSISGHGTLTLGPGAVSTLGEVGCSTLSVVNAKLVNQGTLHVGWQYVGGMIVELANEAEIVNEGVLGLDSQVDVNEDCPPREDNGATIYRGAPHSSGVGEVIVNRGTIQTEYGSQAISVGVPITNDGVVAAREGSLAFTAGGVPTECSTGSWRSAGAQLSLAAGTFNLAPGTSLAEAEVGPGAVIAGCPTPASPTTGSAGRGGGGLRPAGNETRVDGEAAEGSTPTAGGGIACVVPHVRPGATLKKVRGLLAKSHCRVGRVYRERTRRVHAGRVVALRARRGEHLRNGAAVGVIVAEPPAFQPAVATNTGTATS